MNIFLKTTTSPVEYIECDDNHAVLLIVQGTHEQVKPFEVELGGYVTDVINVAATIATNKDCRTDHLDEEYVNAIAAVLNDEMQGVKEPVVTYYIIDPTRPHRFAKTTDSRDLDTLEPHYTVSTERFFINHYNRVGDRSNAIPYDHDLEIIEVQPFELGDDFTLTQAEIDKLNNAAGSIPPAWRSFKVNQGFRYGLNEYGNAKPKPTDATHLILAYRSTETYARYRMSYDAIAAQVNEDGVTTRSGQPWTKKAVARICNKFKAVGVIK